MLLATWRMVLLHMHLPEAVVHQLHRSVVRAPQLRVLAEVKSSHVAYNRQHRTWHATPVGEHPWERRILHDARRDLRLLLLTAVHSLNLIAAYNGLGGGRTVVVTS
jgi:hypothetical protein